MLPVPSFAYIQAAIGEGLQGPKAQYLKGLRQTPCRGWYLLRNPLLTVHPMKPPE
jgi:hypothetical protein